MKASEIRELTENELNKKKTELMEEIFNLRIQVSTQQTTNFARIGKLKKDLARLLTVIREKEISTGRS
ncbi:MAG: 50S ribosomal protein L29 [Candidatus Dadabacteria bacterium RIFCSPHIGHO2_12_FULL_53_21]|jgi:large subunit ribosomal protein L29|nr:MAG: 50S ribosomal protein L29 [Candidatus Dadabacteria bacterium RIFCSPHIGHO2_12_FULL_53_21]